MFLLKKLLSALFLPPLLPLLLVAAGLLLARHRPGPGRFLAWMGVICALLLSVPRSVGLMLAPLEAVPVLAPNAWRGAQAIVILAGGKNRHAPEYGGESVNRLTLERLRYGARLARQTGLPVLVTGGAPTGGVSEAALMKEALEQDFQVPVRWVEGASRDTKENARNSARLLASDGIRRVILVSHAAHLRRAAEEFDAAGLEVVPAPTAFLGGQTETDVDLGDFLPGPSSAYAGWYVSHEWLGLLARRLGL
ncbi:MAG: YdcF family protein [Rhodocyclaceae bacterium]|nr:YdcF family protein [Rhodocyclaceae bacterium]